MERYYKSESNMLYKIISNLDCAVDVVYDGSLHLITSDLVEIALISLKNGLANHVSGVSHMRKFND